MTKLEERRQELLTLIDDYIAPPDLPEWQREYIRSKKEDYNEFEVRMDELGARVEKATSLEEFEALERSFYEEPLVLLTTPFGKLKELKKSQDDLLEALVRYAH